MNLSAGNPSLVPPADELRARLKEINPRLKTVVAYVGALNNLIDGTATMKIEGMTITLPNPFQEFPAVSTALRRAKSRTTAYGAGNNNYFYWIIQFSMYGPTFGACADRIAKAYEAMPESGPTPAQRKEVLDMFASLLRTLVSDRKLLVNAEQAFIEALGLLEEDQRALGEGAPEMGRVIQRYEETIRDQVLKFSLNPTTQGLANIMSKAGGAQLEHLRNARGAITAAAAVCGRAREDVGILAGKILSLIGQYQGVESALQVAEGAAFRQYIGQFQLIVARETWNGLSAYAMEMLRG